MSALVVIQVCMYTFIIVVSCEADNYLCRLVEFSKASLVIDCTIKQ